MKLLTFPWHGLTPCTRCLDMHSTHALLNCDHWRIKWALSLSSDLWIQGMSDCSACEFCLKLPLLVRAIQWDQVAGHISFSERWWSDVLSQLDEGIDHVYSAHSYILSFLLSLEVVQTLRKKVFNSIHPYQKTAAFCQNHTCQNRLLV